MSFFQGKKNLISLATLIVLSLAIPLGIYLSRNTQIFRPKADITGAIALGQGECVTTLNGETVLRCKTVPLILTASFDSASASATATATATATASASITPSPSGTASSSASPSVSPSPSVLFGASVSITDRGKFSPGTAKIKKGSLVTFVNNHISSHTLSSRDNLFQPQRLNQGDQFSFIFTTTGKYKVEIENSNSEVNIEVREK